MVEKVNSTDVTQHYCQFSGGGDICIHGDNLETLVVDGDIDGITNDERLDLSPIHSGTSTSTIEWKRGNFALRKLKHQLWANMITASIMKFISTIPHLNERGILEVDTIIGYGMAYTGIGCIGFYELNMKFGGQTEIISKLDISQQPQQYAAAFADFILDYYYDRLVQFTH